MGNWGKRLRLVFAGEGAESELFDVVSSDLITKIRLKETEYGTYIYPISVTKGANPNELYIDFEDFNNLQNPHTLEYIGGGLLRGSDLPVGEFEIIPNISWWNLHRNGGVDYLEMAVGINGEIAIGFDGKMYYTEYLEINTISINGTVTDLIFRENKSTKEYLQISSIAVNGTYADADGIPI